MAINDYARQSVPREKTVSAWHIAIIYIGVSLTIPAFMLGAQIASSLGLVKGFLSSVIAGIILSIIAGFAAWIGGRTRLSTYFINRIAFGKKGAKLVNLLIALIMLCWFGITINIFSKTLHTVLPLPFYSENLWCIIGGVLMTSTAVWGFKGLDKLSKIVVPLIFISLIWIAIKGIYQFGFYNLFEFSGTGKISFNQAISLQVGGWILGACIIPDLSRYAQSPADGTGGSLLAFVPGLSFIMLLSMISAITFNSQDFLSIMLMVMPAFIVALIIVLASWSSNDNNLYSAGLGFASLCPMSRKIGITIFAGFVGTLIGIYGILNHFLPFLILLGVIISPLAGVYIGDYMSRSRKHLYTLNSESKENFRKRALLAWLSGIALSIITTPASMGGAELFSITGISAIDGLLLSFIMIRFFNKRS